jgi:branched-chain amino acid transport system substrate-binding protein
MQVLADAVEGTKGLDQDKLADWLRGHTFQTVMGAIAFGKEGEMSESYSKRCHTNT